MKSSRIFAGCILATFLFVGCGSKQTSSNATNPVIPTATQQLGFHAGPGAGVGALQLNRNTAEASLPGLFKYLGAWLFQSGGTSSTISMSFSGYCPSSINPGYTPPAGSFATVYGLGQVSDSTCTENWLLPPTPQSPYNGIMTGGAPVAGAGTLSTLRVYSSNAGVTATSLVVSVYINGNLSPITCTIGVGQLKCADDSDTVAVNDGDIIIVTFSSDAATNNAGGLQNLRFMLGKD